MGVVIWTKTDENGDGVDVTYSTDAETGNLIGGFPNGYNGEEWVWRPYAAEFVNLDGTITNDGDAVVLDGSGFVDTMHNVDGYIGSGWNDVFIGGSGSDLFDGAGGSDIFNAAGGYDVLFIGDEEGVDLFTEPGYETDNDSVEIIRVSEGNFKSIMILVMVMNTSLLSMMLKKLSSPIRLQTTYRIFLPLVLAGSSTLKVTLRTAIST